MGVHLLPCHVLKAAEPLGFHPGVAHTHVGCASGMDEAASEFAEQEGNGPVGFQAAALG